MGNYVSAQLAMFLRSIWLGASLALVYDLLRVLRRLGGRIWGGILDALYCLVCAAALFFFIMAGDGELRIFFLLGAAGGMVLYFCLLSQALLPLWELWLRILLSPLVLIEGILKKFRKFLKKVFSFLKSWFTIIATKYGPRRRRAGPAKGADEMAANQDKGQGKQAKKRKRRPSSKLTLLILLVLLIGIGIQLRGMYHQLEDAKAEQAVYTAQYEELQEANARLQEDIDNSDNPDLIAEIARDDLGMASAGEKIFRFQ